MKTLEQIKALQALSQQQSEQPKISQAKASKAGQKRAAIDAEYRKACMKPIDTYKFNQKAEKKPKETDVRKTGADCKKTVEIRNGRKIIKFKKAAT